MTDRRPLRTRSYAILALVAVLLAATGLTLLHWHKDWADPGCQLCHIRHLPGLHNQIAVGHGFSVISEQDWNSEHSGEELEVCILGRSSRSPPLSISFTV